MKHHQVKGRVGKDPAILDASTQTMDLFVLIDTDSIFALYDKNADDASDAQDQNKPKDVTAQTPQYLVITNSRDPNGVSGQGTTNLSFTAWPGDIVRFRGLSVTGNFDGAIITYGVTQPDYDPALDNGLFDNSRWTRAKIKGAAQPDTTSVTGLPALLMPQTFSFMQSTVYQGGTANIQIEFALYKKVGGELQEIFGYFSVSPTVVVL